MVTEHKHKLPWTSWNEESGKYTAGDEAGTVTEEDREKVALWLADPWAKDPKYMHPDAVKIAHLGFIAASYRPEYWYFEVLERDQIQPLQ